MSLAIVDHLENAYRNLRSNSARSLLTTLGITIGIASVTCILALSDGVSHMISGQIDSLDGRLIVVRPGAPAGGPNTYENPLSQQSFGTSPLTEEDVANISKLDGVTTSVPLMILSGSLKSATTTLKNYPVLATTPDFAKVADIKLRHGDFIGDAYDTSTAVIGSQLSIDLFGTDRPIGEQFTMRGIDFTVIGVLAREDSPVNFNHVDINNAAIFSIERGKLFHESRAQIQQINVLAKSSTDIDKLAQKVESTLVKAHGQEEDFSVLTGPSITQPANDFYTAIMQVMAAIAAISLVVGGVGIMNIMLVGVAERTREIGIRKAVGASDGAIAGQFIIESLMVSLLGGVAGYFIGYVVAFSISTLLYFMPVFTWLTAGVALAMSIGIGLIFGLYPAAKAARKNTIESLRQYH